MLNRHRLAAWWRPGSGRRAVAAAAVIASAGWITPVSAAASPIDDQRERVEAITDELERLEQRSDELAEDHLAATMTLRQLDADVAASEERVAAKAATVAALRDELAVIAVRTFTGAGDQPLGPLFTNLDDATEELRRDHLTSVAMSTGTATTDELDAAVDDLNDERDILGGQQAEAARLAEQLDDAKGANDEQKAEYEQARSEAEAELGDLIQAEEERRARESYERLQREAVESARVAAAPAASSRTVDAGTPDAQRAPAPQAGGGGDAESAAAAPAVKPAPPQVPPASSRAGTAISAAMTQLGVPWIFAMAEPGVGFDCSGLTSWAWAQAGVSLPHQSRAQRGVLPDVPISAAQPGDLIFYYSPISHVGIYLGGGQLIHAPNSGSVVNIATVNWDKVVGVGRPG